MATPDTTISSPHIVGSGVFFLANLPAVLASRGGTPQTMTIISATGFGTPSQVSSTFQIGSVTSYALSACVLVAGADVAYAPGDLVFFQGVETIPAYQIPTTGLTISQANWMISTPADASTVNFDLSQANLFVPAPMGGNRALTLANAPAAEPFVRPFTVVLTQDGTGSRTVTSWFAGFTIRWFGGGTAHADPHSEQVGCVRVSPDRPTTFLGSIAGQNG